MWSLPSSRRYVMPAIGLLTIVLLVRVVTNGRTATSQQLLLKTLASQIQSGIEITAVDGKSYLLPTPNVSQAHLPPPKERYYIYEDSALENQGNNHLTPLFTCDLSPNPHTKHIRLPNLVYNITHMTPDSPTSDPNRHLFNPTILALPSWSEHKYLLVSRLVTEGLHQESLICLADICHPTSNSTKSTSHPPGSEPCNNNSLLHLGPSGGLFCATQPTTLNIPPTPALSCGEGAWSTFPSIPGFHDPRIFWSGKGEPLIVVNSASQYACLGLWVVDLRTLYLPLADVLARKKDGKWLGPLMSYPHLTEITRNPRGDRAGVEKNWFLFFAANTRDEAYVHYDMLGHGAETGRTFAMLIGNGFTTPNLTDPIELPCLDGDVDRRGEKGHWHQASNALMLVLCTRRQVQKGECDAQEEGRTVNFAVMHRKFSNPWELPLRYERWLVVWDAKRPFHVLAVSQWPVLFWNETASGWDGRENWTVELAGVENGASAKGVGWNGTSGRAERVVNETTYSRDGMDGNIGENWAYFTYTPSIAWAWRSSSGGLKGNTEQNGDDEVYLRGMHVGYLDDEVIVGIGLADTAQAFARVRAEALLQCMRTCPRAIRLDEVQEAGHTTAADALKQAQGTDDMI